MKSIVFFNGEFFQEDDFGLSPFSRGLHYGDGVFETMRSYGGHVFRLQSHVQRLLQGLHVLNISVAIDSREIISAIAKTLQANKLTDAVVKIVAFRQGGEGPLPPLNAQASFLITAKPFDFSRKKQCERGLSAHICAIRRNTTSPVAFIKSLNYLDNILGRIEARDNNAGEALFLNTHDMVAEGATSNLFVVKDSTLWTPPLQAGILNGITREVTLQIAQAARISCREKDFSARELFTADEAFLTNSVMEIMPLISVDQQLIGPGEPGVLTRELMSTYRLLVEKELNENNNSPIC